MDQVSVPSSLSSMGGDSGGVGTKRAMGAGSAQMTADLVNMGLAKVPRVGPYNDIMTSALGKLAQNQTTVDAGYTTSDAQPDEQITLGIFAKPYAEGWEQGFTSFAALFANRMEPRQMREGDFDHTIADVPTLNYLLEEAAVVEAQRQLQVAPVYDDVDELLERNAHLYAQTPDQFAERWNLLGPMTTDTYSEGAGTFLDGGRYRRVRGGQRLLGFSPWKRAYTYNLFASDLKRGDQLYFVAKQTDAALREFRSPSGEVLSGRSTLTNRFMQVHGFTDRSQWCTSANSNPDSYRRPLESDLDFIARDQRIVQIYRSYEYDEENDSFRYTDENDPQEILNDAPSLLYDAYERGHIMKMGVARNMTGQAPSAKFLELAHRSQPHMIQLQKVELYVGI